jgi:hypothetical protein
MNWFRKHLKLGSRLALSALVLQFVLSFGHFHPIAAQAAPAFQTALAQADLAAAANLAAPNTAAESAQPQRPSNHGSDQPPADPCAICAVIALANSVLFATEPVLLLPQAIELFYHATETGFAHLTAAHPAFHSRAPPLS